MLLRFRHLAIVDDPRSQAAVEFAARNAETGVTGKRGLLAVRTRANAAYREAQERHEKAATRQSQKRAIATYAAQLLLDPTPWGVIRYLGWAAHAAGQTKKQSILFRDIFGNPFRPSKLDPSWLAWNGGAIPKAAAAAYEECSLPSGHLDNARLAVIADMLEETGCRDEEVLGHLRADAVHVRGCFAIDLLLGKE